MSLNPYNRTLKIWESNSQSESSFANVGVHSLTFSCTFGSMKCDFWAHPWPAPSQACTFASLCFGPKPKVRVATSRLKEHHHSKLPNSLFMDDIYKVFSFLTSLPTSHFLDFLQKTFSIHKLFVNETIIILFSYHYIIKSCINCEFRGMPPWIKCLNANSKILFQIYYYNTTRKKPKDDDEPWSSLSSFTTQNKLIKDDDKPFDSWSYFVMEDDNEVHLSLSSTLIS